MVQQLSSYDQQRVVTAVDLVNTYDPWFAEPESLGDAGALSRFLTDHGYGPAAEVDDTDLAQARALRDHLRAVFTTDDLALAVCLLASVMGGLRIQAAPQILESGSASLALKSDPDDPPIARLAADTAIGLTKALEHFGIERLRECAANPCREAFVDTSRNGARRFCSHRCANRTNVAAYRERRRAT